MRSIQYCVYKEAPHYVAQCLNVDVSSFGSTVQEAVELYFEDNEGGEYQRVEEVLVGESLVNA